MVLVSTLCGWRPNRTNNPRVMADYSVEGIADFFFFVKIKNHLCCSNAFISDATHAYALQLKDQITLSVVLRCLVRKNIPYELHAGVTINVVAFVHYPLLQLAPRWPLLAKLCFFSCTDTVVHGTLTVT